MNTALRHIRKIVTVRKRRRQVATSLRIIRDM